MKVLFVNLVVLLVTALSTTMVRVREFVRFGFVRSGGRVSLSHSSPPRVVWWTVWWSQGNQPHNFWQQRAHQGFQQDDVGANAPGLGW